MWIGHVTECLFKIENIQGKPHLETPYLVIIKEKRNPHLETPYLIIINEKRKICKFFVKYVAIKGCTDEFQMFRNIASRQVYVQS